MAMHPPASVLLERSGAEGASEVARVHDVLADGQRGRIPVRVYDPDPSRPLPLVIYLNDGEWATSSIRAVDRPCRQLANRASCVVATVWVPTSPDDKFDFLVEECYAATRWLIANRDDLGIDSDRIGVCGDGAGGSLAFAVALMARDRGAPRLSFQLLLYPQAAPEHLSAYQSFHGLPPGMIVTAGSDPLRDGGVAYARLLRSADVEVELKVFPGAIHGFLWINGTMNFGSELLDDLARYVSSGAGCGEIDAPTVSRNLMNSQKGHKRGESSDHRYRLDALL